ncbi:RNA polymerase-associated protein LEO1-like [Mytilus trossulus]|uniref:RNA polymerase-associated protein LEO1-like n=1 Tax=Mytilus trossulus TaxID=6551 RepID=UPI003005D0FB
MADGGTIKTTQTKTYAEIASSEDTSSKDQSFSTWAKKTLRKQSNAKKCLEEGHKLFECPNDWVCRTCGGSGHKSNYCTTCPNDWLCQTCGKSGHTTQYCNAETVSSSEDSQSESDSDSDNKSSHQPNQKNRNYTKHQSPDLSNSKNRFTFNKQIHVASETAEKQDNNNQNNQSKENPKASDTNSTDEKSQVRKAKRQKTNKDKQHRSSGDQQSMDHF